MEETEDLLVASCTLQWKSPCWGETAKKQATGLQHLCDRRFGMVAGNVSLLAEMHQKGAGNSTLEKLNTYQPRTGEGEGKEEKRG